MEDLAILGNAAAVPIVITITQMLKQNFKFKYGSDILALLVAILLCTGWELYNISPQELNIVSAGGFIGSFRFGVDLVITGFATWLASSKVYDLGYGHKKRTKKIETEKKELVVEIEKLKKNGNGGSHGQVAEDVDLSSQLREILERT